ncbi:cysteine hydrolase [Planktomarina sp.]|nr:cysteine hydrolase [Planktomarina sp.]
MNLARTALLTIDLQNDFLHPEGAYGRAGQSADAIAQLPDRIKPLRDTLLAAGGYFISAQFTLVPGRNDEPLIAAHLRELRPFLGKGDFAPGGFGHSVVDTLAPADFTIEKVAYSAFYQTRLEYVLRKVEINTLIIGGIVTNGGVASTVRDAHVRDIHTYLLTDGTAAFDRDVHNATVTSLGSITQTATCAEMIGVVESSS